MRYGLDIDSVEAWVGERKLFGPVTITIAPGEVVTITGPSGVGKSTLLAIIAGTVSAGICWTGSVSLNGDNISRLAPEKRSIGLLFQDALLFPHLSVAGNLGFGLSRKVRGAVRHEHIADALAQANMQGFENHDPATLSGGEKARIALMRALLAEPGAILLDEPFSKLDPEMRHQIREFTYQRICESNLPCLMVTHDEQDILATNDRTFDLSSV